jgi:hypothetical protein
VFKKTEMGTELVIRCAKHYPTRGIATEIKIPVKLSDRAGLPTLMMRQEKGGYVHCMLLMPYNTFYVRCGTLVEIRQRQKLL